MAYKQNPGRGNYKKTGYGIPQVFDQSPMKQEKNLTRKHRSLIDFHQLIFLKN